MKKTYQLKTNAIKGEQQVIDVTPTVGKSPVKIAAAPGARYELIETGRNSAPDNVRVMRKSKDLLIFFDGENEARLVLENFYEAHTDSLPTLVGRTEQGGLHEYIPESAAPNAVITQLTDAGLQPTGMALGGQELPSSGAAVGLLAPVAAVFSPWLLGAGVLGAAALAGGGSSSSGSGSGSSGSGGGGSVKPNSGNAVGLNIDLDKDNNGYISSAEKGTATSSSVTVTFDKNNVAAGQVLKITDGTNTQSHTLSSADVTAGKVTIAGWILPAENGSMTIKATLTDGVNSTPEATDTAKLVTTGPNSNNAVGLKVDIDSNEDGVVNGSEKGVASTTGLTASFDPLKVNVGDKVIFSNGQITRELILTASDIAAGKVTSTGWELPAEDASASFSAVLMDVAGNSTPKSEKIVQLDALSESLKTALTIAPITGDNILSVSEQGNAAVLVSGKVSGVFAEGDLVTLMVNGKKYTSKADAAGNFSVSVPTSELKADADAMLEANVTGSHGGQLATAVQQYSLASSSTDSKSTAISIDAVTQDNILNIQETSKASMDITGQVTGKFSAGDSVKLLINGQEYKGSIGNDGKYAIPVKISDLLADGDTTVDASVSGTGGSNAKAAQNYGVSITAPEKIGVSIDMDKGADAYGNDGYINAREKGTSATTSLTATFDPTKVTPGDKIVFSDGQKSLEVTLSAADVKAGQVTSPGWILPAENSTMKVTAHLVDSGGNMSPLAQDSVLIDTQAMQFGAPTMEATGTTFSVIQFNHATAEKGTFTLHIGQEEFKGVLDGVTRLDKTFVSSEKTVAGTSIYLEFWDTAGNYSESRLPSPQLDQQWSVGPNTHFIV